MTYGILEWPEEGRRERLTEPENVLGRGQDTQIRIQDMQVGRVHATIEQQDDGRFLLRDLGSVNGTWFNGERVYERLLEPLDEFRLGGPQGSPIRFLLWDEEWDDGSEFSDEMNVATSSLILAPAPQRPATLPDPVDFPALGSLPEDASKTAFIGLDMIRRRHLQLLVEGFGVQTFELSPFKEVTVGRDRMRNLVCLDHRSVSVEHSVIRISDEGTAQVTDLDSTNGTFVNGDRIQEPTVLKEGDRLTFGHYGSRELIYRDSLREEVEVEAQDIAVGGSMIVGREAGCGLVLNHVLISRQHARIDRDETGYQITDMGSANGTFVNGQPTEGTTSLHDNDRIQVGPFILQIQAGELRSNLDSSAIRIDALGLTREVGPGGNRKTILQDVSVSIGRRELVGILGPSGSGKTTFLNALCGLNPATRGRVLLNGLDLYENYSTARHFIGYVPQRDDLHDELTLDQAMMYAARLRLPRDLDETERWEHINNLINLLELDEQRDTRIGSLSGGQRKRVSIGIELLSQPGVLFVDEPTQGLDPRNQERMMYLFRRIASTGCTVVMATHQLGGFDLLDRSMVMADGRMIYFGPVNQFYDYFDVNMPGDIYARVESERSGEEWEERFKDTDAYERFVNQLIAHHPKAQDMPPLSQAQSAIGQLVTLTQRYATQKLADRGGLLTSLLQAPIIALLVIAISGGTANSPRTLFLVVIAALWFGCSLSVRELVDEVSIYRRERLTFLKRWTYLVSKVTVLCTVGAIQCFLLVGVLTLGGALAHHFVETLMVMMLLYMGGVAGGLCISAVVRTSAAAMAAVPLVMFPQILFAGLLVPVDDLHTILPYTAQEIVERNQVNGESMERLRAMAENTIAGGAVAVEINEEGRETMSQFTSITRGNEGVAAISIAMAGRWGLEALTHIYIHDPFELGAENSDAYYQYQLSNAIYLSLYSQEQRDLLAARLLSGRAAEGGGSPRVTGFYMAILTNHFLVLIWAALFALTRRDNR